MEWEINQWKLKEAHEWMAKLEARLDKLEVPQEVIDLTQEEEEGGVGGLIILAEETPAPESVILPSEEWALDSDDERALAGLLVGITSKQEWVMGSGYTPTGPHRDSSYTPYSLDFNL